MKNPRILESKQSDHVVLVLIDYRKTIDSLIKIVKELQDEIIILKQKERLRY